jgi:hypothetical protein
MFMPDAGSEFFHPGSRIQSQKDPGSGAASNNLNILFPNNLFLRSRKHDPGCSSWTPDPGVKKTPDPGPGSASGSGSGYHGYWVRIISPTQVRSQSRAKALRNYDFIRSRIRNTDLKIKSGIVKKHLMKILKQICDTHSHQIQTGNNDILIK